MLSVVNREAQVVNCPPDQTAFALPVHQPMVNRASILLIDNDAALRQLFAVVLTQQGYRCHEASNGLAGLAQLSASQPDLVLLDINMPGLDGFAVLTRIRQQDRAVGVIMCSAESATHFAAKALNAGADGYLSKPVRLLLLLQEVERVHELVQLRHHHPQRQ
jgi:DNA-binding response OmpR family regulator